MCEDVDVRDESKSYACWGDEFDDDDRRRRLGAAIARLQLLRDALGDMSDDELATFTALCDEVDNTVEHLRQLSGKVEEFFDDQRERLGYALRSRMSE